MNSLITLIRTGSLFFASAVFLVACGGSSGDSGPLEDEPPVGTLTNDSDGPTLLDEFEGQDGDGDVVDPPITPIIPITPVTPITPEPPPIAEPPSFEDFVNQLNSENPTADDESDQVIEDVDVVSGDDAPGDSETDMSDSPLIQLSGGEVYTGSVEEGDIVLFQSDDSTSVFLESFSGDAELIIVDVNFNEVCLSTTTAVIDLCTDLVLGEVYFIGVGGETDAEFEIYVLDTPPLEGDLLFTGEVPEGRRFLLAGNGVTAFNLESFRGDADLTIKNLDNEIVCNSLNIDSVDSCNNVDGSNRTPMDRETNYIVSVDGFTTSGFELQAFDAPTLRANTAVQSFVERTDELVFYAQNVSTVELTSLNGDADLIVFDATTNDFLCASGELLTALDSCTVEPGNLRIVVTGFEASDVSLIAF